MKQNPGILFIVSYSLKIDMSTVYIVQDPDGRNIEPARQFGKIFVVLNGKEGRENATKKLVNQLNSITAEDYLLLIGDPVNIGLAMHIAFSMLQGKLQVLVWDRKQLKYNAESVAV